MQLNPPAQPQTPNVNSEDPSAPIRCAQQKVWVDLDDFWKCFQWEQHARTHTTWTELWHPDSLTLLRWLLSFELHWIDRSLSSSLLVFHKPQIYPHQIQLSHIKVMCLIVHTCRHHKCCFDKLKPVLLGILLCAVCLSRAQSYPKQRETPTPLAHPHTPSPLDPPAHLQQQAPM